MGANGLPKGLWHGKSLLAPYRKVPLHHPVQTVQCCCYDYSRQVVFSYTQG